MFHSPVDEEWWDDLFHGCAWAAYIEQAREEGRVPPDSEATRQRAYRYYEHALAVRNRRSRACEA